MWKPTNQPGTPGRPAEPERPRTIATSYQNLLLESAHRLDEAQFVEGAPTPAAEAGAPAAVSSPLAALARIASYGKRDSQRNRVAHDDGTAGAGLSADPARGSPINSAPALISHCL